METYYIVMWGEHYGNFTLGRGKNKTLRVISVRWQKGSLALQTATRFEKRESAQQAMLQTQAAAGSLHIEEIDE